MKNYTKVEALLLSLIMVISAHQNKDILLPDDEIITKPKKESVHYLDDKEKFGNTGFTLKRIKNTHTKKI